MLYIETLTLIQISDVIYRTAPERGLIVVNYSPIEACHGNFGPAKILVLGPIFLRKLVRADHIFLKKPVRP